MIEYFEPNPDDAEPLAAMAESCFVDTFGQLYSPADLSSFVTKAYGPNGLQADVADPTVTIRAARDDGRIIGFAKLGPVSLPVENPLAGAVELRQLYVLKDWQGGGVARDLMDWTLDTARERKAPEMYLSVFTENHRAQRFYARYGFVDIGPYYFMVGEQADEDRLYKLVL